MNPHDNLIFAAWLTTIAELGTAAFIAWLIGSVAIALIRDVRKRWRWRSPIIRAKPIADGRIYSVGRALK